MTHGNGTSERGRWPRIALAALLVAMLVAGVYLVWPSRTGHKVIAYFPSAVGLYPGDDVRVVVFRSGRSTPLSPGPPT